MALIRARKLAETSKMWEIPQWAEEARVIDEWAADLGQEVSWRDRPDAAIQYAGKSHFEIQDDLLATHFRLRFG